MRLALVVALVAGVTQATASPDVRPQPELLRQMTAFATLVHGGTLPAISDARFVRPPSEAELAWIVDRAQPMATRLDGALALLDQLRTVIHAYADRDVAAGKDSPESLAWLLANVMANGDLVDVLLDEMWPTVPHTPTRIDGLRKVERGAVEMLQGSLIAVAARRIDVRTRVHILDVWHAHAPSFRKVWSTDDCTQLAGSIAMVRLTEKDHTVDDGLARLAKDLDNCHGGMP